MPHSQYLAQQTPPRGLTKGMRSCEACQEKLGFILYKEKCCSPLQCFSCARISTENHRKSGPTNQLNIVAWSGTLLSRTLSLRRVTAHGAIGPCFIWAFPSLGANAGNISVCVSAVQRLRPGTKEHLPKVQAG